jgi:hypothetical protein
MCIPLVQFCFQQVQQVASGWHFPLVVGYVLIIFCKPLVLFALFLRLNPAQPLQTSSAMLCISVCSSASSRPSRWHPAGSSP